MTMPVLIGLLVVVAALAFLSVRMIRHLQRVHEREDAVIARVDERMHTLERQVESLSATARQLELLRVGRVDDDEQA